MTTATATATAYPVKTYGFGATPCDDNRSMPWDIVACPQDLILEDGEFVIESVKGARRICRLTGRTRWMSRSWLALTVETFDIDTVVRNLPDGTPAMWGVRGQRIAGTWAINRNALV